MRSLMLAAVFTAAALPLQAAPAAKPAPAQTSAAKTSAAKTGTGETTWIGTCFGEDTQFTQTIGGQGFFHVGNGDRTYDTQKLVQSFFDGKTVCAIPDAKAPKATSAVAEVCANLETKYISVLYQRDTQTKMVIPKNAGPYCKARIDVLKQ